MELNNQTTPEILSAATNSVKYNHTPETETLPVLTIGKDENGVWLIGVFKKDGLYHFYPIQDAKISSQLNTAMTVSITTNDADTQHGNHVMLLLGLLTLYKFFFTKTNNT
jgi:hypothetical protein